MKWQCKECGDDNIPADRLLLHLRLFHLNELPDKWPDGGPVFLEWDLTASW